jgi:hypothetical protein
MSEVGNQPLYTVAAIIARIHDVVGGTHDRSCMA